jgi:hypothetical protein
MISQLRVLNGTAAASHAEAAGSWQTLHKSAQLLVQYQGDARTWTDAAGAKCAVLGSLAGFRRADGSLADASAWQAESARFSSPRGVASIEGRFVFVKVDTAGDCHVRADRFGTLDLYLQKLNGGAALATRLDLLPLAKAAAEPDALGYAHAVTVYGARPAKMDTLYDGVSRLGVGQVGRLSASGAVEISQTPFEPIRTGNFTERENHEYTDLFLEALRARGSQYGNVVYLSSGWDSTSILAGLVHVFGARKVRAVIGRMTYADRSGVINQFELDRAKAIADFYGIPLEVCEFDYRKTAPQTVEAVRPLFRAHQFASATGLNHWRLAEHTAKTTTGDEVVFAGEISDGAHNLGFSQFVTIFHPVLDFREYSDKMASYLYGPTFLSSLIAGKHADDPIWQLFRQRAGGLQFDEPAADPGARTLQFLSSFFLRGTRMPLCSLANSAFLSPAGRRHYAQTMEAKYLATAGREATPETLYSWYLHLYNSFHWQGSTVATLAATAEAHGLRCALPFYDGAIQDFLSAMPESWGRGLDFRNTKYPLKWMLQHRIRYPMHLQVGPHSYLYDVDPQFSHTAELLFGSSLGTLFKDVLRTKAYESWFTGDVFDQGYVHRIVTRFLSGEEFRGAQMNDVLLVGLLASMGRVGEA